MLDIKYIRENIEKVEWVIRARSGYAVDIDKLICLDEERRRLLIEADALKHKKNTASEEIALLKKQGKDTHLIIEEMRFVSNKIQQIDCVIKEKEEQINKILWIIPNILHNSVPVGPASENRIIRQWGKFRKFNFQPKNHMQIAEELDILDMQRAAKITGHAFPLFKGDGSKLVRALIGFMLDTHTKEHNFKEVWPPLLVNRASMTATGQLPKLEEDMYRLKDDDLFLIPTAEVPLTNIYSNEAIPEENLPLYITAYTPCFRREAGTYGRETKGLTRVHQFDKVELVKIVKPENSYDELETLLGCAEKILQMLNIPYRVMLLSAQGTSFAASKCYDIEGWAHVANTYLEVSSCSNFEDFQARRANIRYKNRTTGKSGLVHTLNGSGVALARTIICILENYQQKNGSVQVPNALIKYMDGQDVIRKK
ncbi:serine--tRNA ligase [bacterium Unc6]|nr:serine--tRNA ligase [bacterium Unc6]